MAAVVQRVPSKARLLEVAKQRSAIFQTSFNPTSVRTGAKYLRARLRGPSMVQYYPPQLSISRLNGIISRDADLFRQLDPAGLEPVFFADEVEEQRLADVASLQARGKGKPKKATTQGEQMLLLYAFRPVLIMPGLQRIAGERRRKQVARRSRRRPMTPSSFHSCLLPSDRCVFYAHCIIILSSYRNNCITVRSLKHPSHLGKSKL